MVVPTHPVTWAVGPVDQSTEVAEDSRLLQDPLGRRRGACAFRPVCNLRWRSRELGSWSGPCTLTFLLVAFSAHPAHSFPSLQPLCRSRDGVWPPIGVHPGWWYHMHAELSGQHPSPQTPWVSLLLAARMSVTTGRSGQWISAQHLHGRLTVSSGISDHQKTWPQKAAWVWLVMVLGVKRAAGGVIEVAAANFSTALWPVFLKEMTLISRFLNGNNGTSHLQKPLPGPLQI